MPTKRRIPEAELLHNFQAALSNVIANSEISKALADNGYDSLVIEEGIKQLSAAINKFEMNMQENSERSMAYIHFTKELKKLEKKYRFHRKKAKVIFRKEKTALERLNIIHESPESYINWLDSVKKFYFTLDSEPIFKKKVMRLKITESEILESLQQIKIVESARASYILEKGEAQDATREKEEALILLEGWMKDFYAVARIALDHNPQLLEALGKEVKS